MDASIYKLLEFALIFGAGFAFIAWQIVSTRRAMKDDRDRPPSRPPRHPAGQQ